VPIQLKYDLGCGRIQNHHNNHNTWTLIHIYAVLFNLNRVVQSEFRPEIQIEFTDE
jgi:hypothetical protein